MKRQSAEEYARERGRAKESPKEEMDRLIKKAAAIAKENDISFISGTRSGLVTVGDASELLTISFLITANIAVSAGIPVEKLMEKSGIVFEEMYKKARRLHEEDDRR